MDKEHTRTKIVCTIGPATKNYDTIIELMFVFLYNLFNIPKLYILLKGYEFAIVICLSVFFLCLKTAKKCQS